MGKLSIQDIANVLVEKNNMDLKEAVGFASAMFELIHNQLNEEGLVKVKGLGTFKLIRVEARESVSVRTGERVLIDSHAKVTFTPDSVMKELVNKPFSQFETVVLNDNVDFSDIKTDEVTADDASADQSVSVVDVVEERPQEVLPAAEPVAEQHVQETAVEQTPDEPQKKDEVKDLVEESEKASAVAAEPPTEKPLAAASLTSETEPSAAEALPSDEATVSSEAPAPSMETLSEDEAPVSIETPAEDEVQEEEDNEDDEQTSKGWLKAVAYALVTLVLMAASAFGGYWYGAHQPVAPLAKQSKPVVCQVKPVPVATDTLSADMLKGKSAAAPVKEENGSAKAVEEEPHSSQPSEAATSANANLYDQKDARVRTGAYRIVGTAKEHKVGKGESLERISRRELGEGMSCYIEVYNDLAADATLKEGQVIKIPKLELRKRKK